MKKYKYFMAFFIVAICTSLTLCPLTAEERWAKTYGGLEDDEVICIQQTNSGEYIACGFTYSSGQGNDDALVMQLDPSGNIQWQRTYGAAGYDYVRWVQQTSDGGFIVAGGTTSFGAGGSDCWLLKLDGAGNIIWQKAYGSGGAEWTGAIYQTKDGGYIAAGDTWSFNQGFPDMWVLRLDGSGNILWQKVYREGTENRGNQAFDVQETTDGGFVVIGRNFTYETGDNLWIIKLDSSGNIIWEKLYSGQMEWGMRSIRKTPKGGFIVGATIFGDGPGNNDILVLQLDESGNIVWQKAYGLGGYEYCVIVQPSADGGYIVGGWTDFDFSNSFFLIMKLDPDGNIAWQKYYHGADWESWSFVQETKEGAILLVGPTDSLGAGENDAIVLKLDADGDINDECPYLKSANMTAVDSSMITFSRGAALIPSQFTMSDTTVTGVGSELTETTMCSASLTDPKIDNLTKLTSPFRLKLAGSNFHSDLQIFIGEDTTAWPNVSNKSENLIVMKGGASLKAKFPKSVSVEIKVVNGDGGTATVTYTR